MAEAADAVSKTYNEGSTLDYLVILKSEYMIGTHELKESESEQRLTDVFKKLSSQRSKFTEFAMQNHIAASVGLEIDWFKGDFSHDNQYKNGSSSAEQKETSKRAFIDKHKARSSTKNFTLKEGEVYVQYMYLKCQKFAVEGMKEARCLHYPAGIPTYSGQMTREKILKVASNYYLDHDTWKPLFVELDIDHRDKCFRQNELENKLKAKVYKPVKNVQPKAKPKPAPPKKFHYEITVNHCEDWMGSTWGGNYTVKKQGRVVKNGNYGSRDSFFNWLKKMRRTKLGSGFGVSKRGPWNLYATDEEWKNYWKNQFN